MSGPVTTRDVPPDEDITHPEPPGLELIDSRTTEVGRFTVRRALPHRGRRTVGPWCFLDHMGPADVTAERGLDIGPHPHIGLQTVTWLLEGEALHRDSLGSEQLLRPGQLNLMTAGNGVSHAEEATGTYAGRLHGVQLWIAQPERTRHGDPAFEHHAELPEVDLGDAVATVLVGELAGAASPARRDTDHVGIDVRLRTGTAVLPLDRSYEHAIAVVEGAITVGDAVLEPGRLAYLGRGREECTLRCEGAARALLVGGVPFDSEVLMWWNYVARTRAEIVAAHEDWTRGSPRFGSVDSVLDAVHTGPPPWQ